MACDECKIHRSHALQYSLAMMPLARVAGDLLHYLEESASTMPRSSNQGVDGQCYSFIQREPLYLLDRLKTALNNPFTGKEGHLALRELTSNQPNLDIIEIEEDEDALS